jgi:Ribosomal prokaryotic L21 protein
MIHYRNKTGYKRRLGHRQRYTQVRITGIDGGSAGAAAKATKPRAKAAAAAKASEED